MAKEAARDKIIDEYLDPVIALASEVFFVITADFKEMIYLSPSCEKVWGRTAAELTANPSSWIEAIAPEDRALFDRQTQHFLENGQIPEEPTPFRIVWPDKTIHWVIFKVLPLKDAQGKIAKIAGVIIDITKEKALQDTLDNYTSKLETEIVRRTEGLEKAQSIAKLGSWDIDVKSGKMIWSKGLYELFNLPYDPEAIKDSDDILKLIHPEDVPIVQAVFENALKDKLPFKLKYRLIFADGSVRHHEGGGEVITDKAGVPIKIVGIDQDVTERVERENKIKELNEVRNKFVRIMSHQLRTPLTAINWNLESLLDGSIGEMTPEQIRYIRITHEAMKKVTSRIEDLLTVVDIEEKRIVLEKQRTSLRSLWGSIMPGWLKKCETKNIKVDYRPPDMTPIDVEVDPEKIRRVMEQLADNAMIYTKDGGRIAVALSKADSRIRFEIKDTGVGIPLAEQSRIFDKFFRASNAAAMLPDASGIGLTIAKYFIEQHGGRVGFNSVEGEGSTFWFELPI